MARRKGKSLGLLVVAGVFTQETIRAVPDPLTQTARRAFGSVGAVVGEKVAHVKLLLGMKNQENQCWMASSTGLVKIRNGRNTNK